MENFLSSLGVAQELHTIGLQLLNENFLSSLSALTAQQLQMGQSLCLDSDEAGQYSAALV